MDRARSRFPARSWTSRITFHEVESTSVAIGPALFRVASNSEVDSRNKKGQAKPTFFLWIVAHSWGGNASSVETSREREGFLRGQTDGQPVCADPPRCSKCEAVKRIARLRFSHDRFGSRAIRTLKHAQPSRRRFIDWPTHLVQFIDRGDPRGYSPQEHTRYTPETRASEYAMFTAD